MARRVPSVGLRGVNAVALRPRVKRRLERQASRSAERIFAPQIAAARGEVQQLRKAKRRDLRSVRGAAEVYGNAIDQAVRDAKQSGLKGDYRQQVLAEFAAADRGAAAMPAVLGAEVRSDYAGDIADAGMAVASLRADQAAEAARNYESLFNSTVTDAQAIQTRRRTKRQADRESHSEDAAERRAEYRRAVTRGIGLLGSAPDDFTMKPESWVELEKDIGGEGVGPDAARDAIEELMRRYYNERRRAAGAKPLSRPEWRRGLRDHGLYPYGDSFPRG